VVTLVDTAQHAYAATCMTNAALVSWHKADLNQVTQCYMIVGDIN
jgi:hypothetical protein